MMARYATARGWERDPYESDPYAELREILTPELAEMRPEHLAEVLEGLLGEGAPEDLESFWSTVKGFARSAGKVLQKALPVVGTVAGTFLGGPLGSTLGGAAGKALSGALGGAMSGGSRGAGQRMLRGLTGGAAQGLTGAVAGAAPGLAAAGGSPAAAQLLQTITRPQTTQALLSMAMGGAGRRQVPVGDTPVPPAAIANLLGVLANQAAAEYHQTIAGEASGTPMYLLDDAGELIGDPADPVSRAEALLTRFAEADALEAAAAESDESDEAEAYESEEGFWFDSDELWEQDELDDEYDEFELVAAYEED